MARVTIHIVSDEAGINEKISGVENEANFLSVSYSAVYNNGVLEYHVFITYSE